MIDLHCHILPGLDDGPPNVEFSVAMARAAAATGIAVMVATPHIRRDYAVEAEDVEAGVEQLNRMLTRDGIDVLVVGGAEVSLAKAHELPDAVLDRLCLGDSRYLLVESPYRDGGLDPEDVLPELKERGYCPVLAHPERSSVFQRSPERLAALVDDGALCSVTAASLAGRFGGPVKRFALRLFAEGLVHDVASDAHDPVQRPPDLLGGFDVADRDLPGLREQAAWFTVTAPVAILADRPLPPAPDPPRPTPLLRRLPFLRRRSPVTGHEG